MTSLPTDLRTAIIAGSGRFPFHVASAARAQGVSLVAVGLRGWADPSLAQHVETYEELAVGELGRMIAYLKSNGVRQAIMAGKVTKKVLLDQQVAFDAEALALLGAVKEFSVAAILGAIGQRLAREGITLLDSSAFLKSDLSPQGVLTARAPSPLEEMDVQLGLRAARALAGLDIGQTVVVKRGVVVAVEALEGTDAAIRRAHQLAGEGLVVVKTASPDQDRRFDLPVVGEDTLATLRSSGVTCLAVEAHTTLFLNRKELLKLADDSGISLVGIPAPSS